MKALNVLKSPIVEIGSDSDLNLQSNAVVLFATRAQIQEAISELEALQQPKSCEGCKYNVSVDYCKYDESCARAYHRDYFQSKDQ